MTDYCRPPDPNVKPPAFDVPKGATDCHIHIFGPQEKYPYVNNRKYTPPDSLPSAFIHLAKTLGIERVVVVQASAHEFDNRRVLDALPELGMPARGVAVVPPDISDRDLDELHEKGIRGVRVITVMPGGISMDALSEFGARLAKREWHLQLVLSPDLILAYEQVIAELPCRFVLDHNAYIPASDGIEQPAFQALLRLMTRENAWAKLTAAYHCSRQPPPYSDIDDFAKALIETALDRLVWGSDWPHVHLDGPMPNTTDLFDRLARWLPLKDRAIVLSENPKELYGF